MAKPKENKMVQWITVAIAVLGFLYNGYKDLSNGNLPKAPLTTQSSGVQSGQQQSVMYWQVAFDPNTGKMYHLHKDGKWYDGPPQVREYSDQGQEAMGIGHWAQRASQYANGQSAQAASYPIRY